MISYDLSNNDNKKIIRSLGEKNNNKYLRISEADTINQEEMKEKN